MTVQVYQNEELNDIMFQVEALDEWKQIAAELGMEHQTKSGQDAHDYLQG